METRTTWRKVLFESPGLGGIFEDSVSCGAVPQVPTQVVSDVVGVGVTMTLRVTVGVTRWVGVELGRNVGVIPLLVGVEVTNILLVGVGVTRLLGVGVNRRACVELGRDVGVWPCRNVGVGVLVDDEFTVKLVGAVLDPVYEILNPKFTDPLAGIDALKP
jgi:hypothetical protein